MVGLALECGAPQQEAMMRPPAAIAGPAKLRRFAVKPTSQAALTISRSLCFAGHCNIAVESRAASQRHQVRQRRYNQIFWQRYAKENIAQLG
jgi:hypothetical protein